MAIIKLRSLCYIRYCCIDELTADGLDSVSIAAFCANSIALSIDVDAANWDKRTPENVSLNQHIAREIIYPAPVTLTIPECFNPG